MGADVLLQDANSEKPEDEPPEADSVDGIFESRNAQQTAKKKHTSDTAKDEVQRGVEESDESENNEKGYLERAKGDRLAVDVLNERVRKTNADSYTGTHKAGNHAFRRFRNTYLRNETSCPKGLRDYWLGHTGESMDDLYDRVRDDVEFRRKKAEEYGIGFDLPSVVPNVPRIAAKTKAAKAA